MPPETVVCALDPSTATTGAAILSFDAIGTPTLLHYWQYNANQLAEESDCTLTEVRRRIVRTKLEMAAWLETKAETLKLVAYEVPPLRAAMGAHRGEVLCAAAWNYLTLSRFAKLDIIPVHGMSIKAVYGAAQLAKAPNVSNRGKEAKRRALKAGCIAWANARFDLSLGPKDDAIADAIAIGCAAWKIWDKEQAEKRAAAAQKALFGPGSGTPRPAARKPRASRAEVANV